MPKGDIYVHLYINIHVCMHTAYMAYYICVYMCIAYKIHSLNRYGVPHQDQWLNLMVTLRIMRSNDQCFLNKWITKIYKIHMGI